MQFFVNIKDDVTKFIEDFFKCEYKNGTIRKTITFVV